MEGGLAHAVVYHPHAVASGGFLDLFGEVLLGVVDHVVRPGLPGQLRLLVCGDGGEDVAAQVFDHLGQDQPHPAGAGVNDNRVALLDRISGVAQVVGGHSLEHGGGPGLGIDPGGPLDQAPGGDQRLLGIGPVDTAIDHLVADCDLGDALPDRLDHAGALHADGAGQGRAGVDSGAAVNVGEIDPGGLNLNHRFAAAGGRVGHVLVLHGVGAAELVDLHSFHLDSSFSFVGEGPAEIPIRRYFLGYFSGKNPPGGPRTGSLRSGLSIHLKLPSIPETAMIVSALRNRLRRPGAPVYFVITICRRDVLTKRHFG